jgi:raffinose/stachyose/melibiose transport system substrate-binding protein
MQGCFTRPSRRVFTVAVGLAALMAGTGLASADTVIKWLHVEADQKTVAAWQDVAKQFEAEHAGVKIEMQFLENEAFKAKLPTLLQSSAAPSLFFTWSGGVLKAQAATGKLRQLNKAFDANDGAWRKQINASQIDGMTFDGKIWAVPYKTGNISFLYNKALFQKAGVDASAIKTWDDFLAAVKTLKAAGITPIAGGGGEKWPLHFYWGYLAMREAGPDGFAAAKAGKDGGFTAAAFVRAGKRLRELGALEPFQPGYLGTKWMDSVGAFGDGRAAMILGFENTSDTQVFTATNGKGQPFDNLGRFDFPAVAGAPGKTTDYLGRINGWVITANAPPETELFLQYLTSPGVQKVLAAKTGMIPVAKGVADAITNPLVKDSAKALESETWHQNFLDQDLGPSVGRVVNDMSVEIVSGHVTPEEAVRQIQDAYALQ